MKHTPGPWKVKQFNFDEIENTEGRTIARCFKNQSTNVEDMRNNIAANARLISAAPDLLEALKAMVNVFITENCNIMDEKMCDVELRAMQAIYKAEGK